LRRGSANVVSEQLFFDLQDFHCVNDVLFVQSKRLICNTKHSKHYFWCHENMFFDEIKYNKKRFCPVEFLL